MTLNTTRWNVPHTCSTSMSSVPYFHLLYGQPFSSYMPFWDDVDENDLGHYKVNCTPYMWSISTHESQFSVCFILPIAKMFASFHFAIGHLAKIFIYLFLSVFLWILNFRIPRSNSCVDCCREHLEKKWLKKSLIEVVTFGRSHFRKIVSVLNDPKMILKQYKVKGISYMFH